MREIKFRAWWRNNKYMPKGKMYMVAGFHNIVEHAYDEPERDISDTPQEVFIVPKLPTVEKVNWNEAKDMTLMQYTGLKDKNGKEIYEGDIVEAKGHREGEHNISTMTFDIESDTESGFKLGSFGWHTNEIEVIGNVYENPELVENNK